MRVSSPLPRGGVHKIKPVPWRTGGGPGIGMRVSYEWLSEFVDLDGVTPHDAAAVLTRLGLEVENLTVVDLSQIIVGKVLEQIPHPKSRHPLWVHQVDLG